MPRNYDKPLAYESRDAIPRPIAIDTLDGRVHRQLDPVPDAVYVVDVEGVGPRVDREHVARSGPLAVRDFSSQLPPMRVLARVAGVFGIVPAFGRGVAALLATFLVPMSAFLFWRATLRRN